MTLHSVGFHPTTRHFLLVQRMEETTPLGAVPKPPAKGILNLPKSFNRILPKIVITFKINKNFKCLIL